MTVQSSQAAAVRAAPAAGSSSGRSLRDLTRRPETGSLIGTLGVFAFFAAFGGSQFVSPPGLPVG